MTETTDPAWNVWSNDPCPAHGDYHCQSCAAEAQRVAMTETTARIRWEHVGAGEVVGRVGSLDAALFRIWPPDEKGDCLLFVYLAGHQGDLYHGDTVDGQKAEAEQLLAGFASSLGAIFPEDNDEPGDEEPEPDWRFEWEMVGRTRGENGGDYVLHHKSDGRYRIIHEEDW